MSDYDFDGMFQQMIMTTAANAKQLGLVIPQVKELELGQRELRQDHNTLKGEFEDYKKAQKEKEYIPPEQVQELDELLTNRVSELLNSRGLSHKKYFGKFKRKAWSDGKRHSYVVGKAGVYTKSMFFNDVKEYYGSWTPHGYGVDGYVNYLNTSEGEK